MWPVSARFLQTIAKSHTIATKVTIGEYGQPSFDITSLVSGGSVTIDQRRAIKRTASLTITSPGGGLIPTAPDDLLHPSSASILRIHRGLAYSDGTTELVPLGAFRVTKTGVSDSDDGGIAMTVEASDYSWVVQRAVFANPFAVLAGTTVTEAIEAVLNDRVPMYDHALPDVDFALPTLVWGLGAEDSSDPWTVCQRLADDAGYDLAYDAAGVARMRPSPIPGVTQPQVRFGPDHAHVMLSASRDLDGESLYNGVIVEVQNSTIETPIRVSRWDVTPGSPTNIFGPFGRIPEVYSSSRILTEAMAVAAAEERLLRHLGVGAALSWTQVVNPALDAGDVIAIERPQLGVADSFVLDSYTVPLTAAEPATAEARTVSEAALEMEGDT